MIARLFSYATLFLLPLLAVACASEPPPAPPTPDIEATVTAMVEALPTQPPPPTLAALPTYTPAPSATPRPTLEPLPTYTPYPTLEPLATLEPLPTHTPLPTLEPLPTYTPYPTPTTPMPTATPTPRPTRSPTATPRPTPRPTRTPTPEPSQWKPTGYWSQDLAYESVINEALKSEGFDGQARVATLDAMPTAWSADLSLSVGCIAGAGVVYLAPYTFVVPPSIDTYAVGMWNEETNEWVKDDLGWYKNPILTDDGSAIYIANQAQVRQIVRILEKANQNRNPDLVLNAGMFDSQNDDAEAMWGEFDPTGLQDALRYLSCF